MILNIGIALFGMTALTSNIEMAYIYMHVVFIYLIILLHSFITSSFFAVPHSFSLSLTGKLLYPIADLFAVCWEQLHEKYPLTYLVTSFIPKTISRKETNTNTR